MIKVKKKRITFSKDLDVKFSGKQIKETEKEITLEIVRHPPSPKNNVECEVV